MGTQYMESQDASTLLRSIAEQLKQPLMAIARQAELSSFTGSVQPQALADIGVHAATGLHLVDGYLLGMRLLDEQAQLELEPVSISSLLTETAHELSGLAKQYDTSLELHIAGRYAPVMAHRQGLKAVLMSLGCALLEGGTSESKQLTLAVHRTPHGIVTGLYGAFVSLSTDEWRKALALQGIASQPMRSLGGSAAGLFVAETILQAMEARLRVGRHLNMQGLATTLQSSQQLSLV
jgi:hypothetical protein